ncbi:hypothetical protein [Ekhidna sp.]
MELKKEKFSPMNLSCKKEPASGNNKSSIIEQAEKLLEEKARLLCERGFWPKKSIRLKHKEINERLEALGVYQGKIDRIIIEHKVR